MAGRTFEEQRLSRNIIREDIRCKILALYANRHAGAALFSKAVVEPEVIEQLRVWAVELAEEAEQAEWSAAEEEESVLSVLPIAPGVQRRDRDGAGFT
jgi:hypothetical protein